MSPAELDEIEARANTVSWNARHDLNALVAEVRRLRAALERLASMEAFTVAQVIHDGPNGEELQQRIRYAQEQLAALGGDHE